MARWQMICGLTSRSDLFSSVEKVVAPWLHAMRMLHYEVVLFEVLNYLDHCIYSLDKKPDTTEKK